MFIQARILKTQAEIIQKNDLIHTPGPMADYYRTHYPESWALAISEQQKEKE